MALPQPALGDLTGRRTTLVDPARCRAYALATNDPNPFYLSGEYAPPMFGVVPTWDVSMEAINTVVSPEEWKMLLHYEHDMRFLRPMVPSMNLHTGATIYSIRVARSGTWVTVHIESVDDDARLVLEQFSTMFIRKMKAPGDVGPERPTLALPDDAQLNPLVEVVRHVDDDQTFRYAEASGDFNRIHVDDEFAKSVKLPGIIVHGNCTMAVCGSVVVDSVAGGDPSRLARLAVRFSRPVFPGSDLVISVHDAGGAGLRGPNAQSGLRGPNAQSGLRGPNAQSGLRGPNAQSGLRGPNAVDGLRGPNAVASLAFEAASDGKLVVRNGRAEVRD